MDNDYLRVAQIVGNRKTGVKGILPISRTHFWHLVKIGSIPRPLKLGPKISLWRKQDIMQALARLTGEAA